MTRLFPGLLLLLTTLFVAPAFAQDEVEGPGRSGATATQGEGVGEGMEKNEGEEKRAEQRTFPQDEKILVYKGLFCGCCGGWIDHLEKQGLDAEGKSTRKLAQIKGQHLIPNGYQSCHTGVSREGFVFEGHVPPRMVREFLANPPQDAKGLIVPGMPIGSAGMERGEKFDPYRVFILKNDGSIRTYEKIETYQQQF
ncbi:DUF411 domain-containing protein [Biformimicrobium ophioploci]|nr:DUF411 domain-containing protein [Microbulbifer sp. NKW57]